MAMEVCFEVAAPNREGPNGNENDSQITSWIMIAILSFIVVGDRRWKFILLVGGEWRLMTRFNQTPKPKKIGTDDDNIDSSKVRLRGASTFLWQSTSI